ncbi:hypothetical protein BS47DRAFT_1299839 [Hydnum rufescens UP504]|uniref:Cyclin N-terminal domain-containing protein n=1 Tax=Hydnum rufescens UP504 TaxID=1448309 RepID=A0A9P6ARS7_9AGAM|nr:hypothetical protein BS47DRAFT_1299839 [Hydnum rufescens UP504]
MSLLSPVQRNLASSLLPSSLHDPKLLYLLSLPVSFEIIGYLATVTRSVIGEVIQPSLPTPPPESSSMDTVSRDNWLPELEDFIYCVCSRSKVQVPTLVCTIIFLNRLRTKLPAKATGVPGTAHRLFLASLIAAAKYANDSSPRNKNWVRYAELFDLSEVNLMEKQLLFLLDFDLGFDELETIANVQPLLDLIYNRTLKEIRKSETAGPTSPPAEGSNPKPEKIRRGSVEVPLRWYPVGLSSASNGSRAWTPFLSLFPSSIPPGTAGPCVYTNSASTSNSASPKAQVHSCSGPRGVHKRSHALVIRGPL